MELLHSASNIEIRFDSETKILFCNWVGFQTEEVLKSSGLIIHDLLIQKKSSKVLNDNRQVLGPWYHSVDWTANKWFPSMIDAGLQHFAWVCSRDIFAQLSAKRALPDAGVVKIFFSYEDAIEWLKSK